MNKAEQNLAFHCSLMVLDVVTFIVNLTTSLMFVKFSKRLLVSTHNRILFSMSLADTLVGVFGFCLGILLYMKQPSLSYKLAGNIPMFSSLFGSVLALVLLTVDRLVAVKKPFVYSSQRYRKLITRLLLGSWAVPAVVTILQSMILIYLSSKQELIVRSSLFFAFFFFAAFVLIIFNALLIISIRGHFSKVVTMKSSVYPATSQSVYETDKCSMEKTEAFGNTGDKTVEEAAKNALSTACQAVQNSSKVSRVSRRRELKQTSIFCVVIVCLFMVLWTPLAVYRMYYAVGISLKIAWLRRLALCLTIANSLLNPVFYFLVKKELRRYLAKFLCFWK